MSAALHLDDGLRVDHMTSGAAAVSELLGHAAARRTGSVVLAKPVIESRAHLAAIRTLERRQARDGYRIDLRLPLAPTLSRHAVLSLYRAGMTHAELPAVAVSAQAGVRASLLETARMLKCLDEVGADVAWVLRASDDAATAAQLADVVPLLAQLSPPPREDERVTEVVARDADGIPEDALPAVAREALESWREHFARGGLTFSHGPGFVRIVDRRAGLESRDGHTVSRESVLVLGGAQAEIFLRLESPRSFAALRRHFAARVSAQRLREFLDALERIGLLLHDEQDRYLALVVRHKIVGVG